MILSTNINNSKNGLFFFKKEPQRSKVSPLKVAVIHYLTCNVVILARIQIIQ